ncbi:TBC1D5_4 [Blepharisma stoltei]|uniref:Rab-GAP TBC domain-containing protein n=1 Tax=Blepharisma stoltei TaxID=1481888 RepID=A0AAU9J7X9_9CILI|nr:unnamed protein product [Blepharisma stoltei]
MDEELVPPDFLLDPHMFEAIFFRKQGCYSQLRQLALEGHLGSLHNRFISWKIFLGLLPENGSLDEWILETRKLREAYSALQDRYTKVQSDNLDPLIFNPLSCTSDNPWNKLHADNEIKDLIKLDIDRTFQDRLLFQHPEVKSLLVTVLFIWAKEHSSLLYKQGMNELLGIFFFVAFAEHATENMNIDPEADQYLSELNSPAGIEADIYWIFNRLMEIGTMELFNPVVNIKKPDKNDELFALSYEKEINDMANKDKSHEKDASSVLRRCHRIHHTFLQTIDRELYNHMESCKIEPNIYLQRYLRCMLTREFTLADSLVIWDALFASLAQPIQRNREIILLDFMCVAMFIFVRSHLLECDDSGILRRLLRYPPVEDVHVIISSALSYKEKMTKSRPSAISRMVSSSSDSRRSEIIHGYPLHSHSTEANSNSKSEDSSPDFKERNRSFPIRPEKTDPLSDTNDPSNKNPPVKVSVKTIEELTSAIEILGIQIQENNLNEKGMKEALKHLIILKSELAKEISKKDQTKTPDPLRRA